MLHFFAYVETILAHILVFPACAIEVQHHNESSPAVDFGNLDYEQSLFSCVVRRVNRARQSAALASRVSRFPLLSSTLACACTLPHALNLKNKRDCLPVDVMLIYTQQFFIFCRANTPHSHRRLVVS